MYLDAEHKNLRNHGQGNIILSMTKSYYKCMTKSLFYIALVFLPSCQSKNEFLVDRNLSLLEQHRGTKKDKMNSWDFSVAEGFAYLFDSTKLERAHCELLGDTLKFSVGYSSEGVNFPEFKIVNGQLHSETIMFSDVPEYYDKHIMKIPTAKHELTLNQSKFAHGDTLIGNFKLLSDTIRFRNWNRPIYFEGKFQCII